MVPARDTDGEENQSCLTVAGNGHDDNLTTRERQEPLRGNRQPGPETALVFLRQKRCLARPR